MSTANSPQPSTQEMIPPVLLSSQPEHFNPKRTRIDSIDLLRGIVMVIMMLEVVSLAWSIEKSRESRKVLGYRGSM